ncbi:MAG: hypothetical protein IKZ14_00665 [Muribaculaceae bacterium]|nr:hypothetical protein [Muribaculaceae bacterium]
MRKNSKNSVCSEEVVVATTDTTTDSFVSIDEYMRMEGYELMLDFVKSGSPVRVIPLKNLGSPNEGLGVLIWSKDGEEMNIKKFLIGMNDDNWLSELWNKWLEMLPDMISEHRDNIGYILADSAEEAWVKLIDKVSNKTA